MTVTGAGIPATFAAMAKIVVDAVRPQETAVATGMNTVMRTVGGVIGGQLLAVILTSNTIAGTDVPAESAYTTMFWLCAAAAALAAARRGSSCCPRGPGPGEPSGSGSASASAEVAR